jgi:anti-sigma regulatory factor (Ser/Thr protein kinase)
MSTKLFRAALEQSRAGAMEEALATLRRISDPGFVVKRLRHYKQQPDQREAAFRLEAAWVDPRSARATRVTLAPTPDAFSQAPLSEALVDTVPRGAIDFAHPVDFLRWAAADWDRIPALNLADFTHVDIWVLVALASLRLHERARRPPAAAPSTAEVGGVVSFAHAIGFDALTGGTAAASQDPRRTVKLTRVTQPRDIERVSAEMAQLIVPEGGADAVRRTVKYVLVELLRNVLQHSGDPLGAVAAAQMMGAEQGRTEPMIQLAVADAGVGIPRHLRSRHPGIADNRQALERALLPHISGTFEEGLSGTQENAGLGLHMISEMARKTGGKLLIATTGAAIVLGREPSDGRSSPRFLEPSGIGFPGTLVAFEIPRDAVADYEVLMGQIRRASEERTPKRVSDRWLAFEAPPPGAEIVSLLAIRENTVEAMAVARSQIEPAVLQDRPVALDFAGLDLCTQSWLHALLYQGVRLAWAKRVPIHIVNADPAVVEGLRFLERYALGG